MREYIKQSRKNSKKGVESIREAHTAGPRNEFKKVLIITTVHIWNDTRIFFKEALSLVKNGFKVTLIAISDQGSKFQRDNVRIYAMKRKRRHLRWINWMQIIRILLKEKSEVFHLHDPELMPLAVLLRLFKRKIVFDIHEDFRKQIMDKEWIPKYFRMPLSRIFAVMESILPNICDRIILAEDYYLNNFNNSLNIKVIHNYPKVPLQCKNNYQFDSFKMVYVGDVRRIRGIMQYVDILNNLLKKQLNVRLLIIGSFADGKLKREISDFVKWEKIEYKVEFLGRIPYDETHSIIKNCDLGLALLHPIGNYLNSYPTKIFEYMSLGLPVLASNFKLWEGIILENDCGKTVDPLDVNASCEIIEKYYFSEDLRRKHGTNGRNAIVKRYNWENEEKILHNCYNNLA